MPFLQVAKLELTRNTSDLSDKQEGADARIRMSGPQRYCPVTQAKLDSMGSPVFVEVVGRRIALCWEGCRDRLLANPIRYLNWLDERIASEPISK